MARIDRYLLRQFLGMFGVFFFSFFGLFVVADSVNNFGEMNSYAKTNGGLLKVVAEYYGYRSLAFFDQINALLVLVAAMFTIASFRRHNEMTALLSAGICKARLIRPILIAAAILILLAAVNRELLLPQFRDHLTTNIQDLADKRTQSINPTYDNHTDILISGKGVFLSSNRIVEPDFFLPNLLDDYGRQLVAKEAIYEYGKKNRPDGYQLRVLKQHKYIHKLPSL
ncbi:MAG: LptF/LptG family permease [Planctomycetales bacterium]